MGLAIGQPPPSDDDAPALLALAQRCHANTGWRRSEPRRVCRRLFGVSQAARGVAFWVA
jgi:hypothetical protein